MNKNDENTMKILVAIPALYTVDTVFMISLVRLFKAHPDYDMQVTLNSTIYQAKNELAQAAIDNGYDYILYIDTDTVFDPKQVDMLIADDKDIVGGLCCKREYPYDPMVYDYKEGEWKCHVEIPHELFKADAIGGGSLLLIKTHVLKEIKAKHGKLFEPINGKGEDLSFFERVKGRYEAWVDGRVELGHRGMQTVTPDYWRAIYENE